MGTHLLNAYLTKIDQVLPLLDAMLSYISSLDVLCSFSLYASSEGIFQLSRHLYHY